MKNQEIKERFDLVCNSLELCNKTLSELNFINNIIYSEEANDLPNNFTLDFYKNTLHYCFNSEYQKLFEDNNSLLESSSIIGLNKFLHTEKGESYNSISVENENIFQPILESEFNKWQTEHQKTKMGFSVVMPYQIIQNGFTNLVAINQVLLRVSNLLNLDYNPINIPNADTRTVNFIMDYSNFRKFYYTNYMKSLE